MERMLPRLVFAGTSSGCGKTTVTCAVMQALVNRELKVAAFKCGPDYIDPMFHSRIIGAKSSNLDLFFFQENTLRFLLAKNAAESDISIIEGVMGFYDGMGLATEKASTYEVAQVTQSPVVLVVSGKGASLSVLAVIEGFLNFRQGNRLCGVILNQCTSMTYSVLAQAIVDQFEGRVVPLGFMPAMPDCSLQSRHLGLVTASEVQGLREKMQLLAAQAERSIDLDGLLEIASGAPCVSYKEVGLPRQEEKVRIAVARDDAFCFYYEDSLDALREMGADLVSFSPLEDRSLPEDIHGLYFGGGYPELYAKSLSENEQMRSSVKSALERGVPCIAECGGYMYLTESIAGYPAVGHLPGDTFDTGKLSRFGYVRLRAKHRNLLCDSGEEINAHEFHYWDNDDPGNFFRAEKASGKSWECVHATDRLYAGYPHFHFYSNLNFACNFYNACLKEKHRND